MREINVLVAAQPGCMAVAHLCRAVSTDASLRLACACHSPEEALSQANACTPDVCVLDLRICSETGCGWIQLLKDHSGVPVVAIDTVAETALLALNAGAADFSLIPSGESENDARLFAEDVIERIHATNTGRLEQPHHYSQARRSIRLLAIACGEGGPAPAAYLLKNLPDTHPAVVVVQRNPGAFSANYAALLSGMCRQEVIPCAGNTLLEPGKFYFACADCRPRISTATDTLTLHSGGTPQNGTADAFFSSVASALCDEAACVLLSEGSQGLVGLKKVTKMGGLAFRLTKNAILREVSQLPCIGVAELPLEDIVSNLLAAL